MGQRRTDGQTDARPLHGPCFAYYAGSVIMQKMWWLRVTQGHRQCHYSIERKVFSRPSAALLTELGIIAGQAFRIPRISNSKAFTERLYYRFSERAAACASERSHKRQQMSAAPSQ